MNKKIIYIIFMLLLLSTPRAVFANVACSSEKIINLRQQASIGKAVYEHVKTETVYDAFWEEKREGVFKVVIKDLPQGFYVVDKSTKEKLSNNTLENIYSGTSHTFLIYNENYCLDTVITSIYVNIPRYNGFSEEKICEQIREYPLCGKWYGGDLTKKQFDEETKKYLENLNKKPEEPKPETINPDLAEQIKKFMVDNYIYILLIIISISIIGIIVLVIRERKKAVL